jgi:hypothetical protein
MVDGILNVVDDLHCAKTHLTFNHFESLWYVCGVHSDALLKGSWANDLHRPENLDWPSGCASKKRRRTNIDQAFCRTGVSLRLLCSTNARYGISWTKATILTAESDRLPNDGCKNGSPVVYPADGRLVVPVPLVNNHL